MYRGLLVNHTIIVKFLNFICGVKIILREKFSDICQINPFIYCRETPTHNDVFVYHGMHLCLLIYLFYFRVIFAPKKVYKISTTAVGLNRFEMRLNLLSKLDIFA